MGQIQVGLASEVFDEFLQPSRYKALYGGRGGAKSHFFAEAMVVNAYENRGFRGLCGREIQKSLKESSKRLIEDKIRAFGLGAYFEVLESEIRTPGDGLLVFKGLAAHTADSIKSYEGFDVAWITEASTVSARSLEILRPTIRKPGSEMWFDWNPRNASDPVDELFRGPTPPDDAIIRRINYDQNRFFPAELEAERLQDQRAKPARYAHIWLGEYEPAAIGAIWTRQSIQDGRRYEAPALKRIVVAVDPATSSEEKSDEHGIIVCGIGEDGRGYVLDDLSCKGPPHVWAAAAVAAFDLHEADAVVIETNQGGDMCKATLRTQRPSLPVVEVRASRGKHVRAEPIAALYSLGRVSHVGTYPELEQQMCLMTAGGYEGEGSPDRVDALVWGLTDLFPAMTRRPSASKRPQRRVVQHGWMG